MLGKLTQQTTKMLGEISYQIIEKSLVPLRSAFRKKKNVDTKSRDNYFESIFSEVDRMIGWQPWGPQSILLEERACCMLIGEIQKERKMMM